MDDGPHLTVMPEGFLQVLAREINACQVQIRTAGITHDAVQYAIDLTQCLVILCGNADNVIYIASCEYVTFLVAIATDVILKVSLNF